jgi:hypothetical protein
MARHDPFVVQMELISETQDAILVRDGDHDEGVWLPRSKIEWERASPMYRRPQIIEITMPEWLATDRGLM